MSNQNFKVFGKYLSMVIMFIILLAFATISASGSSNKTIPTPTPTSGPIDPRGQPANTSSKLIGRDAPGYCVSSGGSTSYEYITGVNFTPNPDGTMKLTVQVFIANPTACTAGSPCPEYDSSPEYINAWIDWDGDKKWEPSEKVMDAALTGYFNINYHGTMTAVSQFSFPASITDTTWSRVNLGWSHDPNDACQVAWSWGNVVDQQIALTPPKIKEIKVGGSKDPKNPMTTYDVKLEAVTELPTGYEFLKVSWTGDLKPGEGNPYTYKPDKGTHGKKKIKATLTYKHTASGATGQVSKEHEFKLFFEKKGDEDGDNDPNWFEYWGKDGAVLGLNASDVEYDATLVSFGEFDPSTNKIYLGASAAETDTQLSIPARTMCPGGTFGPYNGIDTAAVTLAHEGRHKVIDNNWNTTSSNSCGNATGAWGGCQDSDQGVPTPNNDDDLPDQYESNGSRTDPSNTDSCNLGSIFSYPPYGLYGDNEYEARRAEIGVSGVANKDWANPGKQSDPPLTVTSFQLDINQSDMSSQSSGLIGKQISHSQQTNMFPGLAKLTGNYSDLGVDNNGDGKFESLRINVRLNITTSLEYNIVGWLQDSSGADIAWAQHSLTLNTGIQQVALDFEGQLIEQHGVNGPYKLARVEVRAGEHGDLADFADNAYTTAAYAFNKFTPPDVTFTGSYGDFGQDTDADGLYDLLNVKVGLKINTPGNYTLVGWLHDLNGDPVPGGVTSTAFSTSGIYNLAFDGQSIYWSRDNGPYTVRHLEIRNANASRVNFLDIAYTTTAYTYNQFQHGGTTINATSYSDQGLDVDNDGDYDYLRVQLQVNADKVGDYHLSASLDDSGGQLITSLERDVTLSLGINTISFDFPGGSIYKHGINGPYQVTSVTLMDTNGTIVDNQQLAHITQAYSYSSFSLPLVALSGGYKDYAQDINGDGKNDYLNIDISVIPGDGGIIISQGRLVDSTGQEIEWIYKNTQINAGAIQTITLPFSATLISAKGKDGPFKLKNLLIYHTGDPAQAISILEAYTTAPYNHTTLERLGDDVLLPIILKN